MREQLLPDEKCNKYSPGVVNPRHLVPRTRAYIGRGANMSDRDWDDLKEEVCTYLAVGLENGEPELETMTRLVWLEREKNANLSAALESIETVVNDLLEPNRRAAVRNSNVLEWKANRTRSV
jgi:hypothetical protein